MATLAKTNPTLLDLANALDPDGSIAAVVEILNQTNEILEDMSWVVGNLTTGHQTTMRTGIPEPTWRKINQGVQPNKSTVVPIVANTGMLEAFSEVDSKLVSLSGDPAAFRLQEDRPHIEGLNQEVAETLFFGNENTEPEAFTGFSTHYNSLTAESGDNIIDAQGTGVDNRSIWLTVWGDQTTFGVVPKGSTAGIRVQDLGEKLIQDASNGSNSGRMMAFVTHYMWDAGLVVKDWRFTVRIANIDKSQLTNDASTGADLSDLMFKAMRLIPSMNMGRPAWYAERDMWTTLQQQLANKTAMSTMTSDMVGGIFVERFKGIPLRRVDKLAADESRVT